MKLFKSSPEFRAAVNFEHGEKHIRLFCDRAKHIADTQEYMQLKEQLVYQKFLK